MSTGERRRVGGYNISAETNNLPGIRFRFRFLVYKFSTFLVTGLVTGFEIFLYFLG